MEQHKFRQWIHGVALGGLCAATLAGFAGTAAAQAAAQAARQPMAVTDLQSTVGQTAAVVEGVVSDIQHDYSDEDGPWTRVTLSGLKTHLGKVPGSFEIRHFGGPLPNGRMVVAAELPVFVQGKRYVVFLRNTQWNLSPVVGDLALRVETLNGTEVLVDSDGRAVTGVGSRGVEMGPALFEGPQYDGRPSQALAGAMARLSRKPLDRQGLLRALNSSAAASGLQVAGSFNDRPAGQFKWRAIPTEASPGAHPAAAAPAERRGPSTEVDTSGLTNN